METEELYKAALAHFGHDKQILKLVEEIAECLGAIMAHRIGTGTLQNVQEELADLEIMTEQMAIIFNVDRQRVMTVFDLPFLVMGMQEHVMKYYSSGKSSLVEVQDMINCVLSSLEQAKIQYGEELVCQYKEKKLKRLERRIRDHS